MTGRPIRRRSLVVAIGGLSVVAWSVQALASGATAPPPAKAAPAAAATIAAPANSVTGARSFRTPTGAITLVPAPQAIDPGKALYTGTVKPSSAPRTVQFQLPNSQNDCVAIHAAHPELPTPPANCVTTVTLHILGARSTQYTQSGGTQTKTGAAAAPAVPADPLPVPTPDMGGTTSVSGGPCVVSANGGCVASDPIDPTHDPSTIVPFVGPSNLTRPVDTNIASNPNAAARGLAAGAGAEYYANSMAGANISLQDNGQQNYYNEIQGEICSGSPGPGCDYWQLHIDTAWHYDYMTVWQDWLTCSAQYWSPWQETINWCGTWNNGGPHKGDPYNYMSSGSNWDIHCCGYNYSHWFRMDEDIYGDANYRGG